MRGMSQRRRPIRAARRDAPGAARPADGAAPPLLSPAAARERVERALAERRGLLADPECTAVRLFNGAGDGIAGLVIERLGPVLIAQLHEGRLAVLEEEARHLCAGAMSAVGAQAVYRKLFPRDRTHAGPRLEGLHRDPTPWLGAPTGPDVEVREAGLRMIARPHDGYSTGIFLEQRGSRAVVRQLAAGRTVLNTFAYTCGFSVAAAAGGALQTISVDVSKRYLEWGKQNFAANGLSLERHVFLRADTRDYLARAARQGRTFDLIVLDPPTFGREKGGPAFSFPVHAPEMAAAAVRLLAPGGHVLLATNHRGTTAAGLEAMLQQGAAAAQRRCRELRRIPLPEDFPGDEAYAQITLARFD